MTDRRAIWCCTVVALCVCLAPASLAAAEDPPSTADRIAELQQDLDSLTEDVTDLAEPIGEFDLFEQCAYLIGVTQTGVSGGAPGFVFGGHGERRRPALALGIGGFGRATYEFLAFPAEEPPSIECNEDAGEEENGD